MDAGICFLQQKKCNDIDQMYQPYKLKMCVKWSGITFWVDIQLTNKDLIGMMSN